MFMAVCFSRPERTHRLADDDALGERDAGERAELRVAAFDELPERRRVSRVATAPSPAGANWLR